jgi:hypothetical protein
MRGFNHLDLVVEAEERRNRPEGLSPAPSMVPSASARFVGSRKITAWGVAASRTRPRSAALTGAFDFLERHTNLLRQILHNLITSLSRLL